MKNDEKDAADLADLLRMGRLAEAWIAPPEVRELREVTRYRIKLAGMRTRCKDQVHAVLAKLGVRVTWADIFAGVGLAWLEALRLWLWTRQRKVDQASGAFCGAVRL